MKQRIVAKRESEVPSMKRIGVIGGFGQWATLDILNRMFRFSVTQVPQYGNRGYPPLDIRMVVGSPIKMNPDGTFPKKQEPTRELLEAAKFVGQKADFVILCANTPHLFASDVEAAAEKPLLSIVDVTIKEIMRRKCKKVGILGITVTTTEGLYQKPLSKLGVECVALPKELSDRFDNEVIWPIQEGALASEVSHMNNEVLSYMREQDVDGIVLGCTEVPIAFGRDAEVDDIINPSQLLAEAAVRKALGNV